MKTFLVIPGLNVEKTVGKVIRDSKKHIRDIIFIDDGSSDNSSKVAADAGAEVIKLPFNHGKGFALRTGFAVAMAKGADAVVCMDSDGQTDPKYLPDFLNAIGDVDVVIGSRAKARFTTSGVNVIGNLFLNFITNLTSFGPRVILRGMPVTDTQSGYRAFRADALRRMKLVSRRYEIEGEVVFEIGHKKLTFREIPIKSIEKVRGITVAAGVKNGMFLFKKLFKL